jgi:hypothetical protein
MRIKRLSRAALPPKLRPLKFNFISDDGHEVTYRAYVSDGVSAPVFALTVITASPHGQGQQNELLNFLAQMRAGFRLNPKSGGTPSSSHHPVAFDPASEVLVIPELVTPQKGGTPAVSFIVATTIGSSEESPTIVYGDQEAKGPIGRRRQKFLAAGGVPTSSTVSCTGGTIIVVHPDLAHPMIGNNHSRDLPQETFIVLRGIDNSGNSYDISGNFHPCNGN